MSTGYGLFSMGKRHKHMAAHRFSYALHHGPIGDAHVLHNCDNPPCVRPDHLHLGNMSQNIREAYERGRMHPPRGEAHKSAKLTADDVREIRKLYVEGVVGPELARRYGVHHMNVYAIIHRRTWKHV